MIDDYSMFCKRVWFICILTMFVIMLLSCAMYFLTSDPMWILPFSVSVIFLVLNLVSKKFTHV